MGGIIALTIRKKDGTVHRTSCWTNWLPGLLNNYGIKDESHFDEYLNLIAKEEAEFKAKQRYEARLAHIEFLKKQDVTNLRGPDYDKWEKFIYRVHELCNVSKTVTPTELAKMINRSRQAAHTWKRKAARMVSRGQLYPHYQNYGFPKDLESFLEY